MEPTEIEMSDVLVVLNSAWEDRIDQIVSTLRSMGMEIDGVDREDGVIEGTVSSDKLAGIKNLKGVDYVRSVFNYVAEEAVDDPQSQSLK